MEKTTDKKNGGRNYGIDLLKILCMFFIVILHCIGHGGLASSTIENSTTYRFVWLMETIAYCAVDIFGLISGYVAYTDEEKKFKISNFIRLWLQVVFYSLSITTIFYFLKENSVLKSEFSNSVTPIAHNLYWYFTAYAALFVFMPLINKAIRNCNNTFLKKMFYIIQYPFLN